MSALLPEEVILEILYRLPIKSLLVCTSVCKSWNSLIKSSAFISTHLRQSISSAREQPLFLLRLCSDSDNSGYFHEHYSVHFDNDNFTRYKDLYFPSFSCYSSCFHVVGSCNGLVCLADDLLYDLNTFILWNPSIRKFIILPEPTVNTNTHSPFQATIQFGYDPHTDDYKLVRMLSFVGSLPNIEVFSLNAGCWRGVPEVESSHARDAGASPAFVNGKIHWLVYKKRENGDGYYNLVLGFDLGDETFREFKLPGSLSCVSLRTLSVMAYRESSVAVVHYDRYHTDRSSRKCNVWLMRVYGDPSSWTLLFSSGVHEGEEMLRIIGFRKNGEILAEMNSEIVSIDIDGGEVKHLGIQINKRLNSLLFDPLSFDGQDYITNVRTRNFLMNPPVAEISFIDTHVESLVLLDKGQNEDDGLEH